jgi:hypothetical protein
MDPTACWIELSDLVKDALWDEAKHKAEDLLNWLEKGGFPPIITGIRCFDILSAKATCRAIASWTVE